MKARSLTGSFCALAAFLLLVFSAQAATKKGPLSRAEVREGEHRLAGLGYWTGPVDGIWDESSRHALVAFQKIQGLRRTGVLTRDLYNALARALPLVPRQPQGFHIEVDLGRQVLFVVDNEGRVGNILPVSSGSGKPFKEPGYPAAEAVTPCGHLEVFSKFKGHRTSPLGELENPLYIVGGIAIHGSASVPTFPASHGCIRIPMFASKRLFDFIPMMTPVLVYGCPDEAPPLLKPAPVPTIAPPPGPSPP